MTITNDLFEAVIRCPTKWFLRAEGTLPSGNVFADWVRGEVESYRLETTTRFTKRLSPVVPFSGLLRNIDFISADWRWAVDATVRAQNLESRFHAIERIPSSSGPAQLVPIRFVRAKRPTNVDKLMLAFDALVLSVTMGAELTSVGSFMEMNIRPCGSRQQRWCSRSERQSRESANSFRQGLYP